MEKETTDKKEVAYLSLVYDLTKLDIEPGWMPEQEPKVFAKRGFCIKCGASIFYKIKKGNSISISAGMFENPTKLKTDSNIFTKGKLDFYKLDPNLRKFSRSEK